MTILTPAQLETIHKQPQSTKLYMSIFQPRVVFRAQVNNPAATQGDRVILYNNNTVGTYTDIEADMTMWVGSTLGGQELGKIRVRSSTSGTITVSENSDIQWTNGAYLTVFNYWELWPIYPRIILDPSNNENVIFYKDYDIAYTNQNSNLGSIPNAGPHRAVWLDPASNQAQIYYSSTGTVSILGTALTYDWRFEGGIPSGSTLADPGYVTYNAAGHYVTRLATTATSGTVDYTYRYVSVYDQVHLPIGRWQLEGLQGSREEGGYTASLKVFQIVPIQGNEVVVLFGDNTYGDTSQNLGGNYPNASDIFFVGYVDKDTIEYDYQHSEVSFDAVSLTQTMKKSSGFSVSVKSVASPAFWYELLDMNSQRAMYHYLRWHTTALKIADFAYMGANYPIQYFDSERTSMYDAIHNYMQNATVGNVVSDRQGKVWLEVDAQAYPDPVSSFPSIMNITNRDWVETPRVEERLLNDVSYIERGGVAYSGVSTGTFAAIIGGAPGDAPGFYGTVESQEGLALLGQAQLNQLVGNLYANKNSPYPTFNYDSAINASNLDIAPQQSVFLSLAQIDTVRNRAINATYLPNSMTWRYDPASFKLLPQIEFKQLVTGVAGQTVTIPSVNDVGDGLGFDPFSLKFPPLPVVFPPTGLGVGDGAPSTVIVHLAERLGIKYGLAYTSNFNSPFPNWIQWNTGLTSDQYDNIDLVYTCPNGAVYVACTIPTPSTLGFLARAPGVGQAFTVIEDSTTMVAKMGSSDNVRLIAIGVNKSVSEQVVYAISAFSDAVKLYIGANGSYSAGLSFGGQFTNDGASLSFGGGQWMWSCGGDHVDLLGTGATSITTVRSGPPLFKGSRHIRAGGESFNTLHWGSTDIALGSNNANSYVGPFTPPIASTAYGQQNIIASSLTGRYILATSLSSGLTRRSTDYGYSWSNGYVSTVSGKVDASRAVEGGFVLAGGVTVQWTDNGGSTWTNKIGDLLNIDPFGVCDAVAIVQ